MLYLIDGYNLLFRLFSSEKKIEVQRNLLIDFLEEKATNLNLKIQVIFDGHHQNSELPNQSYQNNIKIIYTPKDQTADDYILDKIFLSKTPSQLIIISSDKSLLQKAKQLKAQTKTVESFLSFISLSEDKINETEMNEEDFIDTKENIERLLKIFKEKYKDEKN
ncbi:MAG: NYN domain-containing protein [Parachlamydiales bacterium]|jgi:hypothetical protein